MHTPGGLFVYRAENYLQIESISKFMGHFTTTYGVIMRSQKTAIFLSLTLIALSFNSSANDLIFKCTTKNNKEIKLYKNGNTIQYSFGKIGAKPELELNKRKEELDVNLENLSGRYATNSIEIKNGIYSYRLTTSVDRIANEQDPITSLTVIKNGEGLTSLQCLKGSEIGTIISIND